MRRWRTDLAGALRAECAPACTGGARGAGSGQQSDPAPLCVTGQEYLVLGIDIMSRCAMMAPCSELLAQRTQAITTPVGPVVALPGVPIGLGLLLACVGLPDRRVPRPGPRRCVGYHHLATPACGAFPRPLACHSLFLRSKLSGATLHGMPSAHGPVLCCEHCLCRRRAAPLSLPPLHRQVLY